MGSRMQRCWRSGAWRTLRKRMNLARSAQRGDARKIEVERGARIPFNAGPPCSRRHASCLHYYGDHDGTSSESGRWRIFSRRQLPAGKIAVNQQLLLVDANGCCTLLKIGVLRQGQDQISDEHRSNQQRPTEQTRLEPEGNRRVPSEEHDNGPPVGARRGLPAPAFT